MPALAVPGQLHGQLLVVVVQRKPGTGLQLCSPCKHGCVGPRAAGVDHFDGGGVDAEHHLKAFGIQWQITHAVFTDKVFQCCQTPCHGVDLGLGNGLGLGEEGIGQRVTDFLDMRLLLVGRQCQHRHAGAQALQHVGQVLDHAGAVGPARLGAGGPHQIGGTGLEGQGVGVLGALAQGTDGQDLGPDLVEKIADLVAHRQIAQHVAHLDGVLDGQRFLLFHLQRDADDFFGRALLGQEFAEELLEFVVNDLINLFAGLRVLLHHLHNPLDLGLHRGPLHARGFKSHHTGPHAVNQRACRVVGGPQKIRVFQRDAQHRHLQTGKPDTDAWRNTFFRQDRLEHQGDDFNNRFFALGFGLFLQFNAALAQVFGDPGNTCRTVVLVQGAAVGIVLRHHLWRDRLHQRRARWLLRRADVFTAHATGKQAPDLAEHALRAASCARQRRGGGQHAGFIGGRMRQPMAL